MKLVTFVATDAVPRCGAFIDNDGKIVDLEAAHLARWKKPSGVLSSVLAIAEGGQNALDRRARP